MDKLFLCSIRLCNLTGTEKTEIVYAVTKKMIVEDDKIGNSFFDENTLTIAKEEANDIPTELPIIKKVNKNQLTIDEAKIILDAIGYIDEVTPRQIDIFIFRYLLARNIMNKKKIKYNSRDVLLVMSEYMNSKNEIINENKTVDDNVEAVLKMVITY